MKADADLDEGGAVSSEVLERSFKSLVAGTRVGSLFRYDLADPVTIDERQSALVNIVNARVPGEEVLLFRVGSDAGLALPRGALHQRFRLRAGSGPDRHLSR